MRRSIGRVGGLALLAVALSAGETAAQDRPASGTPQRRMSVEGAAGLQVYYRGSAQSLAVGFAPSRRWTLLLSAERSYVRDVIDRYPDGYGFERGATEQFISAELRYVFLLNRRISPYLVGGTGAGTSRANVNEFFPEKNERNIQVFYWGAGARIPVRPWLDAFVDGRLTMAAEARSDYFGVRYPVRAGLAWRF